VATDPEWLDLEPPTPERAAVLGRQARLLALPTLRTMPWPPFVVAFVLGGLALLAASRAESPPPDGGLSVVGALIATWFASTLGDRSAPIADGTPPHVLFRRATRLAMGSPIVLLLWVASVAYADEGPNTGTLSFLFGAEVCVALGVAAIALHVVDPGREVLWAGGGLVVVFIGLPFIVGVDVTPIPSADTWWLREGRWLAIGAGGVLVFLLASLDPAGRHPPRFARPRALRAPATPPVP
jgi:hypothetical protein